MHWIDDFRTELAYVFAEAGTEIARFPYPLSEQGLFMLARFNPLNEGGSTNYISYLLPYWVREQTEVSPELCHDLAIGNIFAMLHYFILDDAIDKSAEASGENIRSSLVLGQLLHNLFYQRYYRHYPAESPIWQYYDKYIADWAAAVYHEGRAPANPFAARLLARKSSPVKLCAVGVLISANRQDQIERHEEAVDLALATLQLADDWADWVDDLVEQNSNAFLSLVKQQLSLDPEAQLDERTVKQAIYQSGCLDRLAEIAASNGSRLEEIPYVPQRLVDFHNSLAKGIRRDAQLAEETTRQIALGGFSYFLSNIPNK
ncbi:hypothetical protein [Cohnella silvisoli]|uniref:Uncharacterized protein n=1 Tax=Cohnella silvisoli TaxID=2873699 RepID=A0ABV1KNY1_9BACL|nr:hypothetical protein [Cohnella silvisoli]MCD9020933.1 hypothetical protein [Cohnella silvisoli]